MTDTPDLNEQEKMILDLWEKGFTGSQIGEQIGKTRSAVLGKLNRLRKQGFVDYKVQIKRVETQKKAANYKPIEKKLKPTIESRPGRVPFVFKIKNRDRQEPVFIKPTRIHNGEPVTLMELDMGMCKYAVSDETSPVHMFCGKDVYKRVYCEEHHKLCYIEPTSRQRYKS